MSSQPRFSALVKGSRRFARELVYEARFLRQLMGEAQGSPRVVVFPSNQPWDSASNLRAWHLAPELRRLGWRVVVVPEPVSLRARRWLLWHERPDVILMQQTRHLLNQPRLYPEFPCVLDADDADYLDPREHDRIVQCASDAAAVVGGSRFVAECLGRHNPRANVIWTCTPDEPVPCIPPEQRPPLVAWAHSSPLGYPAEAELVAAALRVLGERMPFRFRLFGTSEAEASEWFAPLRRLGVECEALTTLPYEGYLRAVAECAVGLQPVCIESEFSRGKSFGKVLAYLAGQVAVVASDAVDHPLFFRNGENGFLCGDDPRRWADAIAPLLSDAQLRARVATAGHRDFKERLVTPVHARLLDPVLRSAIRTGSGVGRSRIAS